MTDRDAVPGPAAEGGSGAVPGPAAETGSDLGVGADRAGHGLVGVSDAGAFLARLVRLDPTALVRLRSTGAGRTALWAHLPWSVLVTRTVAGPGPGDATVAAAELLAELARGGPRLPTRRDSGWRWPLPAGSGRVVEELPGTELRQLAAAAAGTLRSAVTGGVAGRAVGQRLLRDALLDHVAVVVTDPGTGERTGGVDADPIEVSQRLVQAVVRMGFLSHAASGPADSTNAHRDAVQVRAYSRWVGLAAPFGVAWLLKVNNLMVRPAVIHPNG